MIQDIILASGSPRRRELLEAMGYTPRICPSDIAEDSSETDPASLVAELSRQKARAVAATQELTGGRVVIGADTVVAFGDETSGYQILGKPASHEENAAFLCRLSGQAHEVWTGVTVIWAGGEQTLLEKATVHMRLLSAKEIDTYVATGEGLDKAGGYGIQGLGMTLVAGLEGDYYTVMGLPVLALGRLLLDLEREQAQENILL